MKEENNLTAQASKVDYWSFFSREAKRGHSPLYEHLAAGIGEAPELRAMAARLEIVAREGRRQLDKEICITLFGEPPFVRARFLGNPTLDGPTRENVAATTGYKALERICDQLGYQVTVGSVRFTKGFYRVERVSPYAGAIERAMSNKSQASRFCVTVSVRF